MYLFVRACPAEQIIYYQKPHRMSTTFFTFFIFIFPVIFRGASS
jgi:hypothetical protein